MAVQNLTSLHYFLGVVLLLGVAFIVYGYLGSVQEKRKTILARLKRNKFSRKKEGKLDQLLNTIPSIVDTEKRLDTQLSILDVNYSARTFTKLKILAAICGVLLAIYLKNPLVVIPLAVIFVNIPTTFIEFKVNKKLKLFNDQVLEAFQLFISDYTTTKSVQKTIVAICPKLKYPLRKEFERLGRMLNSGATAEESFTEFARRTQNKWTMIFAQMMITYFRNGGDFTPHLMNITRSITSEKILDEQNTTELSSIRLVNICMNILVPIAYITNKFLNPEHARVFTDTPTGRVIIFGVVISSAVSLYLGKKITEA